MTTQMRIGFGLAVLTPVLLLLLPAVGAPAGGKAALDFDRDVRPIISESCFKCHGFDVNQRQAGLRLDNEDGSRAKLATGDVAIVPGKLDRSAMWLRVSTTSPLQMPPAASGKKLTAAQIATLKAWILEGGKYAKHWAFVAAKRPIVPAIAESHSYSSSYSYSAVKGQKPSTSASTSTNRWTSTATSTILGWPRNPIDNFILARLLKEGLRPSPEADKRTLIRRVTMDLTGLPPTPSEVSAYLADKRPDAYERVVDRLLANPHYGERMALPWLDLARYADTHGYHIDSQREMWRWREWVIEAYNKNMPYNEFVTEQIAGDLLPNPTLDQKIATGFNRNHTINFEGGAIPEEYAAAYIEDRIDTTATAFLGLTLRCAQCHDHKYDPFTSKDYYRLFAYFNNVPENGLDGQAGNAAPFIKSPTPEQQVQLDETSRKLAEQEKLVQRRVAEEAPAVAEWSKTALASLEKSPALVTGLAAYYPLDEASGERVRNAVGNKNAKAVQGKPAWVAGKVAGALSFDGNTYCELGDAFGFDWKDKASYGAWVYPTSGDSLTVVSRMDEAAGIRGWDIFIQGGKVFAHLIHKWEDNAIRISSKAAIEMNKWSHVFVTYDGSGKAKGLHIYINGKPAEVEITHDKLSDSIRTDKPLVIGRRNPSAPFKGMIDEVRLYNRELSAIEVEQLTGIEPLRAILLTAEDKRTPEQKETLAKYYLQNNDEGYRKLAAGAADWKKKYADLDASIPTTMVMQEMPKPRDTFMLVRGQYDKKGDKVPGPATPAVFEAPPKGAPANRLGLAEWMVDPQNPLVSRVAVNRYWMTLFGQGLVRTPENFGTQGERPTHPELLDWLACEFMKPSVEVWRCGSMDGSSLPPHPHTSTLPQPWDIKRMVRMMVTSATYRQSSAVSKQILEKDPENRLWAHAQRVRIPAEFVRDQALAVSGLLVPKLGGPSVKPYHPAGLWEEMAFGGGFSAQSYVQDHGDKLYRRSMYTFWKRTVPPPSLQTFDAPEREFCIVRRSVTNTPLQALVTMNDPTYMEAARKLAERILTEPPAGQRERVQFAYQLVLSRAATEPEMNVVLQILNRNLDRYRADKDGAMKILSVGESPRNPKLNVGELAAWTTVASMILNTDEALTRS